MNATIRSVDGKQLNRMTRRAQMALAEDEPWIDAWLALIERRKKACELAIKRHWQRGGRVVEHGFHGPHERSPGISPDSLMDADDLADLLVNRCAGFNLQIDFIGAEVKKAKGELP